MNTLYVSDGKTTVKKNYIIFEKKHFGQCLSYREYPPNKKDLLRECQETLKPKFTKKGKRELFNKEYNVPENMLVIHNYDIHRNKHEYRLFFYLDGTDIDRSRFGTTYTLEDLKPQRPATDAQV